MNTTNKYNYLEDYLVQIRAKGRYLFTYNELLDAFNTSSKAIEDSLYRLKNKKKITSVKKGFYVIVTPEYLSQEIIPPSLFMDDLMHEMEKEYYVGLLSAAEIHGAAHQKPQEYFVITKAPAVRNINLKSVTLNFKVKKDWNDEDLMDVKTDTGYLKVSSPELTALDLMYYGKSVGINQSYTILQELCEQMKYSKLLATAKRFTKTAAIQRLGYLLDVELKNEKLASALFKEINERKIHQTQLSVNKPKTGDMNKKWKVILNTEIEGDL